MGDVSYRPLIEDMTWSYSRLNSFADCPYRWFCEYIHQDTPDPTFYASFGSFMHKLIGKYYLGEIDKEDLPMAFLSGFSENVLGDRPSSSTVKKYITAGKAYFDSFEPFPYEVIAIEDDISFDISGMPFIAFVDYLGKTADGKLIIIDHKSRKLSPRSKRLDKPTAKDNELDSMLKQLYVYAHAVYTKYGDLPKVLGFNCFMNGNLILEPFNRRVYMQTLDWVKKQIDEIQNEEDFMPCIDYFKCSYLCGFNKSCCYYQDNRNGAG